MSRVIPNENSWIGFTATKPVDQQAPTEAELDACFNVTAYVVSLNPTSSGNALPTPALDSLFDRTAIGTSQGSFTGDLYRNDEADAITAVIDAAWKAFPRGTKGYFIISRFGGTGAAHIPRNGQSCEVWPVGITQRAGSNMTSNTVQTFTLTGAVLDPPHEDAVVAASSGIASAPLNLVATASVTAGVVELDWDIPVGHPQTITGYKIYKSTVAGGLGAYTEVTTNITKIGTTAALTALATGLTYFKVLATDAAGDGPQSAFASCTVV